MLYKNSFRLFYCHIRRSYLYYEPKSKEKIDSLTYYPQHIKDFNIAYENIYRISKQLITIFDPLKNLNNIEKWGTSINNFSDSGLYLKTLKAIIYNLPPDTSESVILNELNKNYNNNYLSDFEKYEYSKRISEIKLYSMVKLLWMSTPEETKDIIRYLKKETGLNYNNIEDWDKWWGKRYN